MNDRTNRKMIKNILFAIFVPYKRIEFYSVLNVDILKSKLKRKIIERKAIRFNGMALEKDNVFEGDLKDNEFDISRIIGGRGFVPNIYGKLKESESFGNKIRTRIEVKIIPSPVEYVVIFPILIVVIMLLKSNLMDPTVLIMLIPYFVMNAAFRFECKKISKGLKKLLQAEIIHE